MPRHWSGVENVAFVADELTGVFKAAGDLTGLHDPPLGGSGVHVAEDGVRIEGTGRSPAPPSSPATPGIAAVGVGWIVRVGVAPDWIGEEMILDGAVTAGRPEFS